MAILDLSSLPALIRGAASRFGDEPALVSAGHAERSVSYNQLLEKIECARSSLRALDAAAGDRVVLALEAGPEWVAAFFGILDAGLVVVPVTSETSASALQAIVAHATPKVVVCTERMLPALGGFPDVEGISGSKLVAEMQGNFESVPLESEASAVLAFTSGTTRKPGAVELTHGNLIADLDSILQVRNGGPGDKFLSMLPPAHLFELMGGLLAPLACGASVVYPGSLLPNRIIRQIHEHRITHAMAVPALLNCLYAEIIGDLIESGLIKPERRHQKPSEVAAHLRNHLAPGDLEEIRAGVRSQIGPDFRTVIVGGAASDPAMIDILDAVGICMEVGYGLTEASPIVTVGVGRDCPPGAVGRALPGVEVRISAGGEVLVRGPNVMKGYFGDAEATAAALENGWLKTGDLGRLDENGFLFINGRLKEVLVTDTGETIHPEEFEQYYHCPAFAELCVVGLRGSEGNDVPVLFVVPGSPAMSEAGIEKVFAQLRAAAPSRLRIKTIIRMGQPLPRTATGKVRRGVLAQQFSSKKVRL